MKIKKIILLEIIYNLINYMACVGFAYAISLLIQNAMDEKLTETILQGCYLSILVMVSAAVLWVLKKYLGKVKAYGKMEYICEWIKQVLDSNINHLSFGEYMIRIEKDLNKLYSFYTSYMPSAIGSVAIIFATLIMIMKINIPLAFILVSFNFFHIIPAVVYEKWAKRNYINNTNIEEAITSENQAEYNGFDVIKVFEANAWAYERLEKLHKKYSVLGVKSEKTFMVENLISNTVKSVLSYGMYILLGVFLLNGIIKIEEAIVIIPIATKMFGGMGMIEECVLEYQEFKVAKKRCKLVENNEKMVHGDFDGIEINHLNVDYDQKNIFNDFSLKVNQREKIWLVGENGKGKTTLLRAIAGLVHISGGDIITNPDNLYLMLQEDAKLKISAEDLKEALDQKDKIDTQKVVNIWKEFGLTMQDIKSNIDELSGGKRKKVYLGIAFSWKTEILMLDEPSNSLDEMAVSTLCGLIEQANKTIVLVSHDQRFEELNIEKKEIVA